MTESRLQDEIAAGFTCPDCLAPLVIGPHLDNCSGVAAMESAWAEAFPKAPGDSLGILTLPSPGRAFETAWWAGRKHERENVGPTDD